jgi:hypothetical protein
MAIPSFRLQKQYSRLKNNTFVSTESQEGMKTFKGFSFGILINIPVWMMIIYFFTKIV